MSFIDRLLGRPTLDALVRDVSAWLRSNHPGRFEVHKDRLEVVVFRGESPVQVFIGNLLHEYQRVPRSERKSVVSRFMSAFSGSDDAMPAPYKEAMPMLLPVLRSRAATALTNLDQERLYSEGAKSEPAQQTFLGDIVIGLVVDQPTSMAHVNRDQLAKWGVTFDQALQDALQNLRALPEHGGWQQIELGVWSGEWGDAYESSRILLPDLIHRLGVSDPVAIVPFRNALLVTSATNEAGIQAMLKIVEDTLEENTRWLCFSLLRLVGTTWELAEVPEGAVGKQGDLERYLTAETYAAQKQALDALFEQRGDETFVASYQLMRKGEEPLQSYVVWSEGVHALLPRAECIAMVKPNEEGSEHVMLTWEQVQARFGDLIEPTNLEPERVRVKRFPAWEEVLECERSSAHASPSS